MTCLTDRRRKSTSTARCRRYVLLTASFGAYLPRRSLYRKGRTQVNILPMLSSNPHLNGCPLTGLASGGRKGWAGRCGCRARALAVELLSAPVLLDEQRQGERRALRGAEALAAVLAHAPAAKAAFGLVGSGDERVLWLLQYGQFRLRGSPRTRVPPRCAWRTADSARCSGTGAGLEHAGLRANPRREELP